MKRCELANTVIPSGHDLTDVSWEKSHRSNSQGNCVELAVTTQDQADEHLLWRAAQPAERFDAANIVPLPGRELLLGSVLLAAA